MKGYIGITAYNWWEFISHNKPKSANFWNKKKTFNSLEKGDYFFFLKKNNKYESGERKVVGYGIFDKFEYISANESWEKYREGNGYLTKESFMDSIGKTLSAPGLENIGCIILNNIVAFPEPIYLSEIGIDFAGAIVSGKGIEEEECNKILSKILPSSGINIPMEPKREFDDGVNTMYVCGRCDEIFKKSKRCPNCGQLVKML